MSHASTPQLSGAPSTCSRCTWNESDRRTKVAVSTARNTGCTKPRLERSPASTADPSRSSPMTGSIQPGRSGIASESRVTVSLVPARHTPRSNATPCPAFDGRNNVRMPGQLANRSRLPSEEPLSISSTLVSGGLRRCTARMTSAVTSTVFQLTTTTVTPGLRRPSRALARSRAIFTITFHGLRTATSSRIERFAGGLDPASGRSRSARAPVPRPTCRATTPAHRCTTGDSTDPQPHRAVACGADSSQW